MPQLKLVQGIEGDLLRRKRSGTISVFVALAGVIFQIVLSFSEEKYLSSIGKFFINLVQFRFGELFGLEGLSIHGLTGMLVLIVGFGIYFLFRWTSFLLNESKEPFRYTFWIDEFMPVGDVESKNGLSKVDKIDKTDSKGKKLTFKNIDRFLLLHHDLMEKLNHRIRRFSLLNESKPDNPDNKEKAVTSHIHISGNYAIREEKDEKWIIHIMPRIRVGTSGSPTTLAYPVKYTFEKDTSKQGKEDGDSSTLNADRYNQIVERVYSSIATEIYKQIESDVKGKIALFPTPYLRAVALFHEAEDFARSNTIDAYDRAIQLYNEARRYFKISEIKGITKLLLMMPVLWRKEVKFLHMHASIQIGYAKCLIYKMAISALSGRYKNPLFEIREDLKEVTERLEILHKRIGTKWKQKTIQSLHEKDVDKKHKRLNYLIAFLTFPKDSLSRCLFLKPNQFLFERQKRILFDAYVVAALEHYYLAAIKKAKEYLENARAIDPHLSERNALYILAAGEIEPDIDKEILLFRQATEIAPDFQIAQYLLAFSSEMLFRTQNEIAKARAKSVIEEYDEILKINPGNIAALSAQGYIWWLLEDYDKAKKKYEEGREIKAIARQTFIGDLNYGLARIEAENGNFNKSYDLYKQAISADPGVGAYSTTTSRISTSSYYDYIDSNMLERYKSFRKKVEGHIEQYNKINELPEDAKKQDDENEAVSEKTLKAVLSFVLNDYGNACLKYFHRFGNFGRLDDAINAFEEAIEKYPENAVAYYNLHKAYACKGSTGNEKVSNCLKEAEKLAPAWPALVTLSAQAEVRQFQKQIDDKLGEKREKEKDLNEKKDTFRTKSNELSEMKRKQDVSSAQQQSYFVFSENEFKPPFDIEKLCKVINDDKYDISLKNVPFNTISWLNELLQLPNFYDILDSKKRISSVSKDINIKDLDYKTKGYRNKQFPSLNQVDQRNIIRLNRLLLEETYPQATPRSPQGKLALPQKKPKDVDIEKKEIEYLHQNILDCEVKIQKLDEEIKGLQDKLQNEISPKNIYKIANQTKFTSLFEGLKIDYNGKGVSKLCEVMNERDKFDENDIDALRALAEVWSTNRIKDKEEDALKASEKLCEVIMNYYPENFDTNLILIEIYKSLRARK